MKATDDHKTPSGRHLKVTVCRLPRGSGIAPAIWNAALDAQDEWESRLHALQRVTVIGSRPVDFGNERYDEGFAWSEASGFRNVHAKAHLLDDFAVREKTRYRDADPEFVPVRVGDASCGLLMGAELWALNAVEGYRNQQVNVLVTPRGQATPNASFENWLAARPLGLPARSSFVPSPPRRQPTQPTDGSLHPALKSWP